jgi:hypothetical protein
MQRISKYSLSATLIIMLTACSVDSKSKTNTDNSASQGANGDVDDMTEETKPPSRKATVAFTETDKMMLK